VRNPPVILGEIKSFSKREPPDDRIVKVWEPHYYKKHQEVLHNGRNKELIA
jgi:hypothetical protein